MLYFYVMLAGGCGAVLRLWANQAANTLSLSGFPYATLGVNVVGSFLMGYLSWMLLNQWSMTKELQVALLTGLLGGFTTFSAFSLEVVSMLEQGDVSRALLYVVCSVVLCVLMCAAGLFLARAV